MSRGPRSAAARAAAGAALLAATWMAVRDPRIQRADVALGEALRGARRRPAVDRAIVATTDLGSLYAAASIAAVCAVTGRRRLAADVFALGLTAWSVSQAAKTTVGRARPYEAEGNRRLVRPPTGSSFPSGHATLAVAWTTLVSERATRGGAQTWLPAVGAYVAASRVYAGVHYPTDVVGGAAIGLMLSAAWRGPVACLGRRLVDRTARGARTAACRLVRSGRRTVDERGVGGRGSAGGRGAVAA